MNRNLLLVAISLFTWGIGEGLFIYFQPLYLQELGADPLLIGGIFSAMGLAMAVSQIPAGYLSDRLGSRAVMWTSWIIGTIAAWFMALAGSLPAFIVGIVLYGLTGFVVAPMNSYITTVRGNLSVGRALTFCSGLYHVGAVLGPVTGGVIAERFGFQSIYKIAGIIFILSTLIVFFVHKHPETHLQDQPPTKPAGLLKNYRFLAFLAVAMITYLAIYLPQPLTPNFLQNQHQFTPQTIGILGAVGSLGNAVITLALGSLNASGGFIIGQFLVLLFSVFFLTGKTIFDFGLGFFMIGGYRLARSFVLAIARPMVHPRQIGLAYGMAETTASIAVIAAPLLAGWLYERDPYSVYRVAIVLITLVILMNIILLIRENRKGKLENAQG